MDALKHIFKPFIGKYMTNFDFGGNFGGHLEYLKTLKDARVASSRFGFSTLEIG